MTQYPCYSVSRGRAVLARGGRKRPARRALRRSVLPLGRVPQRTRHHGHDSMGGYRV